MNEILTQLRLHPEFSQLMYGEPSDFRVWERTAPTEDGLPYYDRDALLSHHSARSERRRDISAAANGTAPSTTQAPDFATEIDFRSFACNVLNHHWVCSKQSSPFCVYFNRTVPAVTKLKVKPASPKLPITLPSEQKIMELKCGRKIQVDYVG